ncbi:hypothetical protein DTO280E4_6271 [Paecilomyces variotii]|nr:hypothetical protein DTO280E4_6271 [Paecilomyces variotii]
MQQLQQYGPQILERGSQYPCKRDAYVLHIFPFMQKSRSLLIDVLLQLDLPFDRGLNFMLFDHLRYLRLLISRFMRPIATSRRGLPTGRKTQSLIGFPARADHIDKQKFPHCHLHLVDFIDYHFTILTHAAKRIYDSIIKFRTTSKFLKRRIFYD